MLAASRPMIRTFGDVTDPAHPLIVASPARKRFSYKSIRCKSLSIELARAEVLDGTDWNSRPVAIYSRELRNRETISHSKTTPPTTIHVEVPWLNTQS